MAAYLYTWNPKRWTWVDQADAIYRVNNGEEYDIYWSCGNTKKIAIGDQFFLMRLGVEPKGIVGCGYISSAPYVLPHWDEELAARGRTALRADLLFKALNEDPIISLAELQARFPGQKWTPEASGTTVKEPAATELFEAIQSNSAFAFPPLSEKEVLQFNEGKSKQLTVRTYDRSPRARQACIQHYGYACTMCGFNFGTTYGSIGETYIEVHHLQSLAEIAEEHLIDPIRDLRPVCANCHRMLHRRRPPYSIEDLFAHSRSPKASD